MNVDERKAGPGPDPATLERADALRRRAERRAKEEGDPWRFAGASPPLDDVRRVIHEIRVHQIELEIQNEELLRIQAELDASRKRYFDLYDLAPVAYLTLSDASLILEANLTAANLLGEERGALVDRPFTRFVAPSDQDTWYRQRRLLFETGAPQSFELAMRRADGAVLSGLLDVTLARDDEGTAVSRAVVSDISERKREELERRRLEHRLQQAEKTESLGRMAGAIAHHFNNLLGVTTGNLEMILGDLPSGAEPPEALTDALTAAREAVGVSGLLLTYLGQPQGEQAEQDLSEICRRFLPILRASMPARMDLVEDLPSPGPTVNVIAGQIQRVLTNLVTNAWEAVDGRGVVCLALRTVGPEEIPTNGRFPVKWAPRNERYSCLSVTDPGAGIEGRLIDRIFDPFFSTKAFGRGLGLSVALGAVTAHGGAIAVRDGSEGGTTVEVYLPVAVANVREPRKATEGAARSGTLTRGTVLLVEDEEMLRKMGAKMLGRLGFGVIPARDGVEAVELFRENRERITWVFCDLTMPRMNGWDTLVALRAIAPDVHVVLTSGFDEAHAMPAELAERPHGFLAKPWTLEQLLAVAR